MMKNNPEIIGNVLYGGSPFREAESALILVHGRGASAGDIMQLGYELKLNKTALAAPQADGSTWYPYSFLEPVERNEPYLSNSLRKLADLTDELRSVFAPGNIFFLGFSQGACLVLEYAVRHPDAYGGIFALSGGLIGKENRSFSYQGVLNSEVFIGCSDTDPHIPLDRLQLTENILQEMKAKVTMRIYPGMGHTINNDEMSYIKEKLRE